MLIRLIGGVEVAADETRWRTVPGKRGCVLAVLAVAAGEAVSTDELTYQVWGGAAVDLAAGAVYPHITRLRAMLPGTGATVIRSGGGYVLDVDPDKVDLLAVRRLAVRAREKTENGQHADAVRDWWKATALLRGDALAGVDGDWADQVRRRFSAETRSILTDRFRLELRLGRHRAILDELLAGLTRFPTCEALAEQLMLALYRSGRQVEALDVYARTVARLRDELGIDPSASFQRTHHLVLNQDEELAAPREVKLATGPSLAIESGGFSAPAQLPATVRGFVGRDSAMETLRRTVDRCRVLVVDGMPGVGKTALAVCAANELAARYPDGQLFIDLHGFSGDVPALTPGDALERMLTALGADSGQIPVDVDSRSAELRTRLAGRRVLIVLDNAANSAQVRPLLPGGGDCLTIVTSRRRMPDLLEASPVTLDIMDSTEALRLLESAVDDPERIAAALPEAADLVESAGRLPLAIRLIAARLRNRTQWTAGYLSRRLRDRSVLEESSVQGDAVASAFSVSYAELDEGHRRIFRLLGLYPGQDFDAAIAAAVAGVDFFRADHSLEALVDSHLLLSGAPGRYRFHDLMRHYASTIVVETESAAEVSAARRRMYDAVVMMLRHALACFDSYVGYYPRLVEAGEPSQSPCRTRAEATRWLRAELPNLKAVMRAANGQRMDSHCVEMAAAMSAYHSHLQADHDLGSIVECGLDSARRIADRECESFFLNKLAGAHQAWGDVELAERFHKQALTIRRELGDPRYIVASLTNLALVHGHAGEYDRAIALRGEALQLVRDSSLAEYEALIRTYLAGSLCSSGRLVEARGQLERADESLTDSHDAYTRTALTAHWGLLKRREGCPVAAQRLHEQALEAFESANHWAGQVQLLTEIAEDLLARQRWDEA